MQADIKDGLQAARSQSELLHAELSVLKQEMGGLGLRPVASEPALMHRQRLENLSRPQTSEPRELSFRGPSVVPPKFRSAQVDVVRHQSDVAQRKLPSKQRVQLPPPPSSNKMTLTQHDAFTSYLESLGLNTNGMRVQAPVAPRFAARYNMRRTRMGSRNDARPLEGLAKAAQPAQPAQPFQMPMPGRADVAGALRKEVGPLVQPSLAGGMMPRRRGPPKPASPTGYPVEWVGLDHAQPAAHQPYAAEAGATTARRPETAPTPPRSPSHAAPLLPAEAPLATAPLATAPLPPLPTAPLPKEPGAHTPPEAPPAPPPPPTSMPTVRVSVSPPTPPPATVAAPPPTPPAPSAPHSSGAAWDEAAEARAEAGRAEARAATAKAAEREAWEVQQRLEARASALEAAAAAEGGGGGGGGGGNAGARTSFTAAPIGNWPVDPETDMREQMELAAAMAQQRMAMREAGKGAERLHRLFTGWEKDPVRTGVRGKPGFRDGEKRGMLPRAEFGMRVGLQPEIEIEAELLEELLDASTVGPPVQADDVGDGDVRQLWWAGSFGGKKLVPGPMVDVRKFASKLFEAAQAGHARLGDLGAGCALSGAGNENTRTSADALGKSYMSNPWASEDDEKWNLRRRGNERVHEIQTMSHIFSRHGSERPGSTPGTLDRNEFKNALNDMGLNLSSWEVDAVVQQADRDNDGHIDAAEFVATMSDFKQSASRILFGGAKKVRSGGVAEAMNWTPAAITAFELNLTDREVKRWLRAPGHLTFPAFDVRQ